MPIWYVYIYINIHIYIYTYHLSRKSRNVGTFFFPFWRSCWNSHTWEKLCENLLLNMNALEIAFSVSAVLVHLNYGCAWQLSSWHVRIRANDWEETWYEKGQCVGNFRNLVDMVRFWQQFCRMTCWCCSFWVGSIKRLWAVASGKWRHLGQLGRQ